MLFLVYFVTVLAFVSGKNEEYKGYKIYKITLKSDLQQENLLSLKNDDIDYLRKPNFQYGVEGLALLPYSGISWFEDQLVKLDIPIEVYSEDVYEYLKKNSEKNETNITTFDDTFDIRRYHRYDDIRRYLLALSDRYNTEATRVETVHFGTTHEDRPLYYLKITSRAEGIIAEKPAIVVESAINPREWITIPAALNVVERILAEQRFLEGADWIILPVVNPDGYEYTHTHLRLWSKSRSIKSNLGPICPGVNINRNFDIDWQGFDASSSPCSHLYTGIEPFSEIETRMVQDIIRLYGSRIKLYISLQNNGGFVSYPWSYERAASGMFVQHHRLGLEMIKSTTDTYKLGVSSTIFDRASGTSSDYARINNVLYTFNIDIEQRGEGVIVPESDIGVIIDNVWKMVAVAANEIFRLYS